MKLIIVESRNLMRHGHYILEANEGKYLAQNLEFTFAYPSELYDTKEEAEETIKKFKEKYPEEFV